jgi:two-component sensor histidine kinase
LLSAQQVGDQLELTVSDDGVGMKDEYFAQVSAKHGSDYVAIFVRQVEGTIAMSKAEGAGTIVRIRLPLLASPRKR